jgi:hypothetical protein
MKSQKLRSDFNCALAWAIFTLGASQLAFVLGGPITFLIVLFCCASLFAFFLVKVQAPGKRSLKRIAKPYLLSTGILLASTLLYYYLVFLKTNLSVVIFLSISILPFFIPLLITIPFLRKSAHVSQ